MHHSRSASNAASTNVPSETFGSMRLAKKPDRDVSDEHPRLQLLTAIGDGEFNVVGAFGQLLLCAVVSFNLPTISAFGQGLVESKGRARDALIDVRRGDAYVFRIDAKLVISRLRVVSPF